MSLIIQTPWGRQPQFPLRIANNFLGRTITHCFPLNGYDKELRSNKSITITNGTYSASGSIRGLTSAGSSSCASIALDLSAHRSLTLSFWLYWNAYANDDDLAIEFTTSASTVSGGFAVDPNSAAPATGKVQVFGGYVSGSTSSKSFERPSVQQWHHYGVVYDYATTGVILRATVDGVLQSLTTHGSTSPSGNFANSTLFFLSRNNASLFGAGKLANVIIRGSHIASEYELAQEYLNPWSMFQPISRRIYLSTEAAAGNPHWYYHQQQVLAGVNA